MGGAHTPGETDVLTSGRLDAAMDPREACLKVLADAAPETLHWTVVLDRALTERLIDPFTTPNVRGVVVKTLAALAKEGRVVKAGTGLYRAADA
jgi:hypothetical protein